MATLIKINGSTASKDVTVPLGVAVTLENDDNAGLASITWEIPSYPEIYDPADETTPPLQPDFGTNFGAWTLGGDKILTLVDPTPFAAVSFVPDLPGTYIVRLTDDAGTPNVFTARIEVVGPQSDKEAPGAGEAIESGSHRGWARNRNRQLEMNQRRWGWERVNNATVSTINQGKVVKIDGAPDWRGNTPNVVPSGTHGGAAARRRIPSITTQNGDLSGSQLFRHGIVAKNVAADADGWIQMWGTYEGDFSAFAVGQRVYVDAAGDLSATVSLVSIGYVTIAASTGAMWVDGLSRQSDESGSMGFIAFNWKFSTLTGAADPGNGKFRFDNGTPASVTKIYIDQLNDSGFDMQNLLTKLSDGTEIVIQQTNDSTKQFLCRVNGAPVDNTGWWTITVDQVQAIGGLFGNNQNCTFVFFGSGMADTALTAQQIGHGSPGNELQGSSNYKYDDVKTIQTVEDAGTTNVLRMTDYRRTSTGTVAAGFGIETGWQLEDDNNNLREAAQMQVLWRNPASATPRAAIAFRASNAQASELIVFNHSDDDCLFVNVPIESAGGDDERGILMHGQAGNNVFGASIKIFGNQSEGNVVIQGVRHRSANHEFRGQGASADTLMEVFGRVLVTSNTTLARIDMQNGSTSSAFASTGSFRYNEGTDKLQWQQNGSSWLNLDAFGSGVFSGSLANTQIAFGTAADTIGGEAAFTYNSGTNTMSVDRVLFAAGTEAAPSLSTPGDTNTGAFFLGSNQFAISCAGTKVAEFTTRGIGLIAGTAANPAFYFDLDDDGSGTGWYRSGTDTVSMSSNGNQVWEMGTLAMRVVDGSATNPSHSFLLASQTGMYLKGPELAFAVAGVEIVEIDGGGIGVISGTAASPSFYFQAGDDGTGDGFFRQGAASIGVAVNGIQVAQFDVNGFTVSGSGFHIRAPDGTAALAGLAFSLDVDCGLYRETTDTWHAVAGGQEVMSFNETGGAARLSFYGGTTVAQPSVVALTNSITSGGTNDTLTDWADLSTYATDAAAIRNAVYQLGRKVSLILDALHPSAGCSLFGT